MPANGDEERALGKFRTGKFEDENVELVPAGADAGAGTQPHDDKSYISNDAISIAHSIAPVRLTDWCLGDQTTEDAEDTSRHTLCYARK
jgi:hypothetical protein